MTSPAIDRIAARIRAVYGGWGPGTTVDRMRADWEALFPRDKTLGDPEPVSAGGVPAVWVGDAGAGTDHAVLFLHGGGFQVGSTRSHHGLMSAIAAGTRCRVLGIDYRLAPEHRFPAQLEDALAAYDWLVGQGVPAHRIALAGDSAGGGLAVSTMLALKTRGTALPAAAVLMSPWTDMTVSGASYETRAKADPIHQRAMIETLARTYLGRGGDPADPLASPIHGDLSGLPPLLVQVGGRETLLDDAVVLAERAKAAGVAATLEIYDGMIHVFQLYRSELAEAREALEHVCAFLRRHIDLRPRAAR